ncbi:hypothetical protein JTE90_005331 [Oedothorax gibbosus]|uniref:Zinc finger CHCC-type domain-containing protein n=1 Tax=Oedothorax gibbosus TaxID=931172 RepID=A0AAV6UHS8_9ARAC|nr:hypothetical protein JTE90_005331 [Oedothorax gibbosus]
MAMSFGRSFSLLRVSNNVKYSLNHFCKIVVKGTDTQVTHTGQKFEEGDSRMVRFINTEKQVNPHFAIDLINSVPPKMVKERVTSCDGGGGALGHPKVYINLDQSGPKACGYCGLRFELDHHH